MAIHLLGKKLSSFQIIILGFLGAILMGAFLLMLPDDSTVFTQVISDANMCYDTADWQQHTFNQRFVWDGPLHVDVRSVRHGARSEGYSHLLVLVRAGRHTGPHTDRRSWNRHIRRVYSPDFRKKDFTA